MEGFERFRHIDSHFASKQILKGFDKPKHPKSSTENNPVMGYSKTFFIPEAKGLKC